MSVAHTEDLATLRRQLRLIAVLHTAADVGLTPLPSTQLHVVAYFADALAPVWDLRIIDSQLLKRQSGPMSPALQRDLDLLVGRGVVAATDVRHVEDSDGAWRLDALYALNPRFADPIIRAALAFPAEQAQFDYVREVVYAIASLGLAQIASAPPSDAAYGDSLVDVGGLLDIAPPDANRTVHVARRFGELVSDEVDLTNAEMVHLYVRELYKRLERAA
jgi:hypothetical protein